MEITGKLIQKLQSVSGEGKNGPWTKGSFIIETFEQYPRKICFMAWNDKASLIENIPLNEVIKVFFDAESREFNDKWYTDLKMWKIEKLSVDENQPGTLPDTDKEDVSATANATVYEISQNNNEISDDLPF